MRKKNFILFISLVFSIAITYSHMGGDIGPYDTGLYHLQTVATLKENPFWIGIGNLHDRLVFNNSNFYFVAIAEYLFPNLKSWYVFNPFYYFLILFYVSFHFFRYLQNRTEFSLYFFIILLIIVQEPLFVVSISADSVTYYLGVYLISELVITQRITIKNYLFYFSIFFFLVTIKISTLSYSLLFIPFIIKNYKKLNYAKLMITSFAIFTPWIVRSIIISGYIVYPILAFPFFDLSWKIPQELADSHAITIKYWAITQGNNFDDYFNKPFYIWVPKWYNLYSSHYIHGSHTLFSFYKVGLFSLIFHIIFFLKTINHTYKRNIFLSNKNLLFLGILFVINLIWFFSAPDPRFSYASLTGFVALLISINFRSFFVFIKSSKWVLKKISCFLIVILVLWTQENFKKIPHIQLNAQIPIPSVEMKKTKYGLSVYVPKVGDQCWKVSNFCTPYFNPDLDYWDKKIKEALSLENDFGISKNSIKNCIQK